MSNRHERLSNGDDEEEEDSKPKNSKLASLIEKAKQVSKEQLESRSNSPPTQQQATTTDKQQQQEPVPDKQRKKRLIKRAKKKSPNQSPKQNHNDESSSDDNLPLSRRFSKDMKRRISLNTVVEKLHKASSASSSTESNQEQPREQSNQLLNNQARMSSSAISSRMSEGSSSDCLNVDFSAAAIKKRKRVLDRLADTPEFTQARKSSSSRSRRAVTGRAKRDAARDASESITQVIQDEKTKLIKATSTPQPPPSTTNASEQHQEAATTQKPKVINKSPKKSAKSRKRARSKETIRSKADELQHGWMPLGETFKRPILKPEESSYIEKSCFDSIECRLTGRKLHRRQDVVIFAGEGESPYYAKIVDFFMDSENSNGTLMAWIYWYYRRDDIDAPSSTYRAGEDELIASRHHDAVSVATILTAFTMLTFNEYCRFRSFKSFDNSMYFPISPDQSIDSDDELQNYHAKVFFCRRFYENSNRSISAMPSFLRLNSKEVQKVTSNIKLRPR